MSSSQPAEGGPLTPAPSSPAVAPVSTVAAQGDAGPQDASRPRRTTFAPTSYGEKALSEAGNDAYVQQVMLNATQEEAYRSQAAGGKPQDLKRPRSEAGASEEDNTDRSSPAEAMQVDAANGASAGDATEANPPLDPAGDAAGVADPPLLPPMESGRDPITGRSKRNAFPPHKLVPGARKGRGKASGTAAEKAAARAAKREKREADARKKRLVDLIESEGVVPVRERDDHVYAMLLNRVKGQISRFKHEEHLIQSCGAMGFGSRFHGAAKQSHEMQRAMHQLDKCKHTMRDCVRFCEDAMGDARIPDTAYDSQDEVEADAMVCSRCGVATATDDNDVLLCDGQGCNRAYHEKCLVPRVVAAELEEDDDWLCPSCDCRSDICDLMNETFGTTFDLTTKWQDIAFDDGEGTFPAASDAAAAGGADHVLLGDDLPDDSDSDDGDFDDQGKAALPHDSDADSDDSSSSDSDAGSDGSKDSDRGDGAGPSGAHRPAIDTEPGEVLDAPRRRTHVNYAALNEVMFGASECYEGEALTDKDFNLEGSPRKRAKRPRRKPPAKVDEEPGKSNKLGDSSKARVEVAESAPTCVESNGASVHGGGEEVPAAAGGVENLETEAVKTGEGGEVGPRQGCSDAEMADAGQDDRQESGRRGAQGTPPAAGLAASLPAVVVSVQPPTGPTKPCVGSEEPDSSAVALPAVDRDIPAPAASEPVNGFHAR